MVFGLDTTDVGFPDPSLADPDGLLAIGGDLSVLRLLNAYHFGIFPWYCVEGEPYWFSPEQRMVLFPSHFHCSKSLSRTLASHRFEVRIDTCFREVMTRCALVERADQGGTWIDQNFIDAYCELHDEGFAHSFETFQNGRLVGGLYGVSLSDYFCGESMFHEATDASKAAFARMVDFALLHRFRFIDTQMYTPHLASLGAEEISRRRFMELLEKQEFERTYRGRWRSNSVVLLIGGNEGDRVSLIMQAMVLIADRVGTVSVASSLFETEPWGFESPQRFLNQALVVDTDLPADEVLHRVLEIEKELGRIRPEGFEAASLSKEKIYSSRPMDIDLIFYNNEVINTKDLIIPHPRMHQRRFVLEPLLQIIPDFIHPKLHKTVSQLYTECLDKGEVNIYF